jgi:hypothetical protein
VPARLARYSCGARRASAPAALLAAVLLACLIAGCGAERASAPSDLLPAGAPLAKHEFAQVGMTISLPSAMTVQEKRPAPSVFRATYADWYMAAFAYPRREQIPRKRGEVAAARRRLVRQVRKRDSHFKVARSRTTKLSGAPAVELIGDQTLSGARLRTRSLHVYKGKGEYVLELVAPVGLFAELDERVFDPVVTSLRVTGKVKLPKAKPKPRKKKQR